MPVASAFHGLFSDLPVLTVQTNCAFDAKSYDAPKNDIPSPNAVDPQEDDDGPPVLEPIRGGASWMVSEPVLSPIPSMKGDQPAPLAEHITFKPTMLSPIPPLTIGPPLLSSPYDDCYSPSSSGYSSADSRCSFFVPSTAAFRSASVLSLPTLPFERLQHGLFNQSAFTPWRNRLPTFHDYPFQQPVAPSTDAFRPASTECSSMTCSTPLSATSFSAFGTHTLLHRSPPFFAANSPLSSDEASSSGISSASSSFSDHSDHGRDHIGVHGYARQCPPTSTPPVAKGNATQESPPIIRPEPVWPTAVNREPRIENDVQPPVLEKCEPIGDDERAVRHSRQSECTPISDNESPKSETRSSGERSGICMVESLPTIMKTVDNEMERPQTARSSVSDVMLAPPEMPTPTSPAVDTSQLRVSPLKIRIPSRNADRDNKDEPAAKSPKLARNSLRKQPAVEDRTLAIRRKKSSTSRKYGRNASLKRNSLESSASEGSLEDASELTNRAQDFHMDHIDQPSPSTSSDYYLSKESAIPTTPTKRDSFDSDSQKENYDDFRWPPYNMRVRKQSNPSTPVKKPLSKLIRKASTASQKRKESINETTNVPQPHSPRKRRNSLRPTKFRSNWTPADQGTYQPVILALDAPPVQKLCYEAIRHNRENVVIHVRDCVKVCSSEGLENVGKIMRLYFDKIEKTLMASILWYYTPAQLDPRCTKSLDDSALRTFQVQEKELLASRHVDNVAVDAIESVAYVLTFNQYCRYKAEVRWKEQFGMPVELTPNAPRETFGYRRTYRLPDETTDPEVVYFCRAVYNLSHKRIRVMPKPQLPLKTKPPSRRGSSNTKMSAGKTAFVV